MNIDKKELQYYEKLAGKSIKSSVIDPTLYEKYEVKKGLRDINGVGVVAGLTEIGEVIGHEYVCGEMLSVPGRLKYRGIDIKDIVNNFLSEDRYGFEEVMYLLLFGNLPSQKTMDRFNELLSKCRMLPESFIRENILTVPSKDMMNTLARGVLTLYSYDDECDDISIPNVVRQCIQLIACFPLLAVYGYQAYLHFHRHESLTIHNPLYGASTAENFLHMLRPDSKFTKLEAKLLDLALVLHAEHGGGNNSSFITHVATSSDTDTYSVIAAALGSLKGPRHGGSNYQVVRMIEEIKENVSDWKDEEAISAYLTDILDKKAFDRTGFIYGIGHAVYSISDPRAEILKHYASLLADEKGLGDEFQLYSKIEKLAPRVIEKNRTMYKGVSVNVDFYSGLVYKMLNIPMELITPLFAVARIVGWSAHRLEELANDGKIIRPAYKSVAPHREYVKIEDRPEEEDV